MDIKMHAVHKTPDLGDGKVVDPVQVTYKMRKGASKDSCCSIDEEKRQLRANRPIWRENFTDFCRNGTLHGLRHLVDTYSKMRRIIWLIIIVLVLLLFFFSVFEKVVFYLSYPVTTVLSVHQNTTLEFPAVTICNKNPCRLSAAYRRGWQGLLHNNANLSRYLESVEVLDFQKTCAQGLNNMIVKCEFNGQPCVAKDFQETYTDLGHCFTFNGYNPSSEALTVQRPGPMAGLTLLLNAETAEYSPSLVGQEGFQVTVHDGIEVPAVNENGIAIAPGTSTNLAMLVSQISSLPAPYGTCGVRKLMSPGPYKLSKCRQECLLAIIRKTCFCDAVFLNIPMTDTSFPICGMKIYEKCVKPLQTNYSTLQQCDCPQSCDEMTYFPKVSFSRLSNQFIEQIIANKSGYSKDIENDFVQNKLLQYHHANQHQENVRLDDVITAYNRSVSVTYPLLKSSILQIADMLKNFSSASSGREQFLTFMRNSLNDYDTNYQATIFSALQSARLLVNKYLDAVTAFAFVTDQVNYTSGTMDENRVSQILRLKLDEFRIHYEYTIQSLDRVDKFYSDQKLSDFTAEQKQRRRDFRTGIISLYANISAISMHQSHNIDMFYNVADTFNQVILPNGAEAYRWYDTDLRNMTSTVSELSARLMERVNVVNNGPREWDNFVDSTIFRAGSPSYVFEAERHWEVIKSDYLKSPGNITLRNFIIHRANADLSNLTHFVSDLYEDLHSLEKATLDSLDLLEVLYSTIINADILPSSVLGTYPIWNLTSNFLQLQLRWASLAERNRPMVKSVFVDTLQRVRETLLSRKIKRQFHSNGVFDRLKSSIRAMDENIQTSLTKLKDHMTYFVNSVSIEKVFKQQLYTDNFCQLNIYFSELSSKHIKQMAVWTTESLLFHLATLVAILLGGSVFTFIELLDVVVRSIYTKCCVRTST